MSRQEEVLAIREEMRECAETFAGIMRRLQAITGDGYGSVTVILSGSERADGTKSERDYILVNNAPGKAPYISECRIGDKPWDSSLEAAYGE